MAKDYQMNQREWHMFNKDKKLFKSIADSRYYCKCGHSVCMSEKTERKFCDWCKHWVYKDPVKQEEYDNQIAQEEERLKSYKFRKELMKRL